MILEQFYLQCLSHASYLVADEGTRIAAVIDPRRDVEPYVTFATERGLKIRYVILTHFHADFVAGHLELQSRTGAVIMLGAKATAEYEFAPLQEGRQIVLGRVNLEVLETPGHTPEAISLVASEDGRTHAVFTGDTLFIGDVGRPDLMASSGITAEELAGQLYDSLREKLLTLPDETLVYPAHGAGSLCGRALGSENSSTIGKQRQTNHALQPMTREAFVTLVTSELPRVPAYFAHDARQNRATRPTLDESLTCSLVPMSLESVLAAKAGGAQLLDTRSADAFAAGHLEGSINVPLDGKFATWAGTVLCTDTPLVLVTAEGSEEESAIRLGRVGLDRVLGYLDGGGAALERAIPDRLVRVERVTAAILAEWVEKGSVPFVCDVRSAREWADGHLDGSLNIPLPDLKSRAAEVPADVPVLIHCAGGYRSSIAASILQSMGRGNLMDLVGGYGAWEAYRADHPAQGRALGLG